MNKLNVLRCILDIQIKLNEAKELLDSLPAGVQFELDRRHIYAQGMCYCIEEGLKLGKDISADEIDEICKRLGIE